MKAFEDSKYYIMKAESKKLTKTEASSRVV